MVRINSLLAALLLSVAANATGNGGPLFITRVLDSLGSRLKSLAVLPVGGDGDVVLADWSSLRTTTDGFREVWLMTNYRQPLKFKKLSIKSSMDLVRFDCINSGLGFVESVNYSEIAIGGEVLFHTTEKDKEFEFTRAVPGTVGAAMLTVVCAHPGRP